ncbi:hypothetical protein ACFO0M_10180 [Micromonospora mangrovi]|uniref:DUF3054 domain-containing protein n=2 Tax=Micromonospora TaxID=1873 RepID=A0AAU8HE62_9ACTN
MRRVAAGLRRRVGHRGSTLLFLALVDLVYCYRLLFPSERDRSAPWLTFLTSFLPLPVWAVLWGGVGLLCLSRSWRRKDSGAFACAIAIKVLWTLLAVASGVIGGVDQWYLNAVIFGGFAGFVAIIASWPEPPRGWKERQWTHPSP